MSMSTFGTIASSVGIACSKLLAGPFVELMVTTRSFNSLWYILGDFFKEV